MNSVSALVSAFWCLKVSTRAAVTRDIIFDCGILEFLKMHHWIFWLKCMDTLSTKIMSPAIIDLILALLNQNGTYLCDCLIWLYNFMIFIDASLNSSTRVCIYIHIYIFLNRIYIRILNEQELAIGSQYRNPGGLVHWGLVHWIGSRGFIVLKESASHKMVKKWLVRLGAAVWALDIWAPDIWAPGLSDTRTNLT